jgi:hypothetical protein
MMLIVKLILLGVILLTVISVVATTLVVVGMLLACRAIVLAVACRCAGMIVGCIPLALLTLSHPGHERLEALGTDLLPLLKTLARLVHLGGVGDLPDRPS